MTHASLAKEAPESRVSPVSVAQDVEGEQGEEQDDEEAEDEIEVSDLMIRWEKGPPCSGSNQGGIFAQGLQSC
ncbi:hypothetical protein U1Q18_013826 [Sarracenia purpurea var. burkii]